MATLFFIGELVILVVLGVLGALGVLGILVILVILDIILQVRRWRCRFLRCG